MVKQTEKYPRRSWMVWEEDGKYPDLIIELLSDSTTDTDKTLKRKLYQDRFRTHEYFWFSPDTLELAGFRLINQSYEPITANASGWLWSEELELYLGIHENQLRCFSSDHQLILTAEDAALQAQQRADRLAAQLRSLGIEQRFSYQNKLGMRIKSVRSWVGAGFDVKSMAGCQLIC